MPAEQPSRLEERLGPLPEVNPGAISELQDSFYRHVEPHQLEKISYLIASPELARLDADVRADQQEVLAQGTLHDKPVGMIEALRTGQAEIDERLFIARVLMKSPSTAETLVEGQVAGFHATNSYALAGIIEGGAMLSGRSLFEQGKVAGSGAGDAAVNGQPSISFGTMSKVEHNLGWWSGKYEVLTDSEVRERLQLGVQGAREALAEMDEGTRGEGLVKGALRNAAQLLHNYKEDPDSLSSTMLRHKFPVVVGINADFIREAEDTRERGHLLIGESSMGEFRPNAGEIPIEALPVIGVPANHVQDVEQLLFEFGRQGVKVVAIEDLSI